MEMDTSENLATSYTVTLDDDPVICDWIEKILGMRSFVFSRAEDLVDNLDQLDPIGVFIDIHLDGDITGLDVLPQIRKRWPLAPIIVITGDDSDELVSEALAAGADDFIQKPIRPGELIGRLNARKEELKRRNGATIIKFCDITLDSRHRVLSGPKGQVYQSPREVEILAKLMSADGVVIPKDALKRQVWGKIKVTNNALDRKLYEVRKSIKEVTDRVELKSVYKNGIAIRKKSFTEDQFLLGDLEVKLHRQPSNSQLA